MISPSEIEINLSLIEQFSAFENFFQQISILIPNSQNQLFCVNAHLSYSKRDCFSILNASGLNFLPFKDNNRLGLLFSVDFLPRIYYSSNLCLTFATLFEKEQLFEIHAGIFRSYSQIYQLEKNQTEAKTFVSRADEASAKE